MPTMQYNIIVLETGTSLHPLDLLVLVHEKKPGKKESNVCIEHRYKIQREKKDLEDLHKAMTESLSLPSKVALPSPNADEKPSLLRSAKPKDPVQYRAEVAAYINKAVINAADAWAARHGCCCLDVCKAYPKFLGLRQKTIDMDPPLFVGRDNDHAEQGDEPYWKIPERALSRPYHKSFNGAFEDSFPCQLHLKQDTVLCQIKKQSNGTKIADVEASEATNAKVVVPGRRDSGTSSRGSQRLSTTALSALEQADSVVDPICNSRSFDNGAGSFDSTAASPCASAPENGGHEASPYSTRSPSPTVSPTNASAGWIGFFRRTSDIVLNGAADSIMELVKSPRAYVDADSPDYVDEGRCQESCDSDSSEADGSDDIQITCEEPDECKDVCDSEMVTDRMWQLREGAITTGAAFLQADIQKLRSVATQDGRETANDQQAHTDSLPMTASVVRELALLSDYIYPLLGYSLEWTMNPKFVYAIPLSTAAPIQEQRKSMPNPMRGLRDPKLEFKKYAKVVLTKALTGLKHMHDQMCPHEYLSPECIMVEPNCIGEIGNDPAVKLAWLPGIRRKEKMVISKGGKIQEFFKTIPATLGFRSPEGSGLPGDIWSFACVVLVWFNGSGAKAISHPWTQCTGPVDRLQMEINEVFALKDDPKALLDLHGRIASEDDAQVVQALVNFVKLLQPAFEYDPQDRPTVSSLLQQVTSDDPEHKFCDGVQV